MHLFEAASTADARHAAEMLVRAGRRALDRLAYEDAADRFDRALQALELADAEDESGPALLARGDALLRAGEPEAARAAFTQARALALRRGDVTLLWRGSAWVRRARHRDRRPRRRGDRAARGGAGSSCGPRAALAGPGAPRRRALLRTRPHSLRRPQRRGRRHRPRVRGRRRARLRPERTTCSAVAARPRRGAPCRRRRDDRCRARVRRPPCRTAGPQLACRRSVRARGDVRMAGGDRTARAARR